MKQTWRWFGPKDIIDIEEVEQAGVQGIVTALHHLATGDIWTIDDITKRQREIKTRSDGSLSSLKWDVVESLPVSEDIKTQTGDWKQHIENYKTSLRHIAHCGIEVVCYNFMPVLDWTRTDLFWKLPDGADCMRFDLVDMAVFDCLILERDHAQTDYSNEVFLKAQSKYVTMSDEDCNQLTANIIQGLPGTQQTLSLDDLRDLLATYDDIDEAQLRAHLEAFLEEVVPVAEELGIRLCCHPDDPPFPLLGLPRIVSTEDDYAQLIALVDSPANGITLCCGSLGVHPDNDLPGIMERLGHRVHFLHLRNTRRQGESFPCSFYEAAHLDGDTDMVAYLSAILNEEQRRKDQGRSDWQIPMRPDHGHRIGDDFRRANQPGYPYIGRLRGLAELRGVIAGLEFQSGNKNDVGEI